MKLGSHTSAQTEECVKQRRIWTGFSSTVYNFFILEKKSNSINKKNTILLHLFFLLVVYNLLYKDSPLWIIIMLPGNPRIFLPT